MRLLLSLLVFISLLSPLRAESPSPDGVLVLADQAYKQGEALTDYEKTRCKLDVYLPKNRKGFATLVWFHGGGLKNGDKNGTKDDSVRTATIAQSLASAGIAVVTPNYRLSPKVSFPAYIEDAAAAVAWANQHAAEHGGNTSRIFVGGHSAGGYLALMLGMDPHYLNDVGIKSAQIAGFIPVSGQTMTHYTVREERGEGKYAITADAAAPIHFCRKDAPPFLVLYADHDMAARAEENSLFVAMMKATGHQEITGQLIEDRTHGTIAGKIVNEADPAREAILKFMAETKAK